MKKVSFIIPCYRSQNTIGHVVAEIEGAMEKLADRYGYEIVLVNDCSPDDTMGAIRALCAEKAYVKGIGFARNFGQHVLCAHCKMRLNTWKTVSRMPGFRW